MTKRRKDEVMPLLRFELRTSRLLSARSNQLSYRGGGTRYSPGPHKMDAETDRFQHGPATALWGGAGQVRVFAHLCAGLLLGEFVLLLSLSLSLCLSLFLPRSLPLSCTSTNRCILRADADEEGWCWATHQGQRGLAQGADKARTGQGCPVRGAFLRAGARRHVKTARCTPALVGRPLGAPRR